VTKENIVESNTRPTQSGERVSQGLHGVRERARKNKQERFTALLHHVTRELLRESFYALKRKAAPGVDGVTWQEYATGLEDRLEDLHGRVHRGAYRAQPSKRCWIPKANGKQRPLGIATLEDKIVQQAVVTVLNAIYEEDFRGFSYGFRPGRSQHMALDALYVAIKRKRVNWILDLDLKSFFDNISKEKLVQLIEIRIADPRILRLIQKWLRAGVMEDGVWSETEAGTPQGAVISPLLSNVYLHYVLDQWTDQWRQAARGEITIVRYADDAILGFEHQDEAERYLRDLKERLREFGLELNEDKTRLIRFGRFASVQPGRAWRRETGVVHLPGAPAYLWEEQVGQVRSPAHHGRQSKAEEAAGTQAGTPAENAHADCAGRGMAAERAARLLPIPCGTGEPESAVWISETGGAPLVQNSEPAHSTTANLGEGGSHL
jgi:RNA-directed DNA polymerase